MKEPIQECTDLRMLAALFPHTGAGAGTVRSRRIRALKVVEDLLISPSIKRNHFFKSKVIAASGYSGFECC